MALVGLWTLDEGTGTTANDTSGNSNTGTLTNSPTWVKGYIGLYGVKFVSASNEYIAVASSSSLILPSGGGTIMAWVNYTGSAPTARDIINQQGSTFSLTDNGSSKFRCRCYDGVNNDADGTTTIVAGVWYHVAGTYDGSNVRLYVQGVQEGSHASGAASYGGSATTTFGAQNGGGGRQLDATLDDIRIYSTALSAAQVHSIYLDQQQIGGGARFAPSY